MFKKIKNYISEKEEQEKERKAQMAEAEKERIEKEKQRLMSLSDRELLLELYFKVDAIEKKEEKLIENVNSVGGSISTMQAQQLINDFNSNN